MERLPQENSARDGPLHGRSPPPDCAAELPGFRPAEAANDVRMAQLARTIEQEIIPRLMLAHRSGVRPLPDPAGAAGRTGTVTEADVKHFAKLVLSQEEDSALATIRSLRLGGVSVESIYLDLLAPTARYLGRLWEEDLCNFTDVTVGLGRLQRVLRELSPGLGGSLEHPFPGRRVLLLPSPGEQHTFGLVMVGEFFRRAGWDVVGGAWAASLDATAFVANEWFDAVGFSLGAEVRLHSLASLVQAVRGAARNPQMVVLVGGPLFGLHPEYAGVAGADGMTIDGREAPALAESLIGRCIPQQQTPG